jgi:hypothetical protein
VARQILADQGKDGVEVWNRFLLPQNLLNNKAVERYLHSDPPKKSLTRK